MLTTKENQEPNPPHWQTLSPPRARSDSCVAVGLANNYVSYPESPAIVNQVPAPSSEVNCKSGIVAKGTAENTRRTIAVPNLRLGILVE